jgi:hypothetical protein
MVKLVECKKRANYYFFNFRFVISDKDTIRKGLEDSHKLLALDQENQKQILKKLQESINENTKHYNEVYKTLIKN